MPIVIIVNAKHGQRICLLFLLDLESYIPVIAQRQLVFITEPQVPGIFTDDFPDARIVIMTHVLTILYVEPPSIFLGFFFSELR